MCTWNVSDKRYLFMGMCVRRLSSNISRSPSAEPKCLQGANPVSVKVTLRGKKYDVKGATSVEDVQKSVEEQAGLAKEQQVLTENTGLWCA